MTKNPFNRRKKQSRKNSSNQPDGEHDAVEFQTLDLEKLIAAPQKQYILRLISILNDLDSGSYLSNLLSQHQKTLPNIVREKWRDGVVLYLLRLRIAIIYTALYDILKEMKNAVDTERPVKRGPRTPRLLWHTIIDDNHLDEQLAHLVQFIEPGSSDSLGHVRNKLAAHADGSALSNGLKTLAESQQTGIAVRTKSPQRFRSFIIDDVISKNWQQKAIGSLESKTKESIEIEKYAKHITDVTTKTADFVYALFHKYCDEYSLRASEEQHKSIQKELQADAIMRNRRRLSSK